MSSNTDSGLYSDITKSVTEKSAETQQLQEERASRTRGGARRPPFNPVKMAELLEHNETHAKCVHAKSRYVAGFGINIIPHPEAEDPDRDGEQYERVWDFWFGDDSNWQVGPVESERATATNVLQTAWTDYEAIGWLTIEILTQTDGTPTGLAYVPGHTIRKRMDERGFVQLLEEKEKYFGVAGDRYQTNGNGDLDPVFVDADDGSTGTSVSNPANELIFKRNHSPLYPHYGAPDIIPAVKTIRGDSAAQDYNIDFFENDGVPRIAIIVKGAELTEKGREEMRNLIEDNNEDNHRTAFIETEKIVQNEDYLNLADGADRSDVEIRLEPLTVGIDEEASFLEFRGRNEHDILKVHDVPPVIAGVVESGAFSTDAEEQRKEFAEETIQPKQHDFGELLYELVHKQGLDAPDWTIEFELAKPDTKLQDVEIASQRVQAMQGLLTVNELRDEFGFEPFPEEHVYGGETLVAEVTGGSGPGGGIGDQIEQLVEDRADEIIDSYQADLETEQLIEIGANADS
ncbi:portal protein [Natrialba phage PhiCh1]|uniref:Portal protein n=1 Tax=Natrialba phage PhiCh1 TaxID=114777 RepID=A0A481W4D9_9CAUD|nr:portal protein [Natrialba phage PhiCh1]QBJ01189.1 portal protein [Natrialba phage PhiCh1]